MRRAAIILLLTLIIGAINPPPAIAAPAAQGSSTCETAVYAALAKQGAAYVWGAKGPGSFDCSGLTYWAYQQAGINIGISTYDQQAIGSPTGCTLSDLSGGDTVCWRPGDLIFLSYSGGQHVALYAGEGLFIDAYNASTGVILHDVAADSYYWDHFWHARRPTECGEVSISPGTPTPLPTGNSPDIEAIANILGPISLELPWACGSCGGQAEIETLEYPAFGPDPLYPFKWFGVWLWNEVFRSLICWLLAIAQAMLNAAAYAINTVYVAGINLVWRLAVLALLWIRDMFLSIWVFVGWLRLMLWQLYGSLLGVIDQIGVVIEWLEIIGAFITNVIAAIADLVIALAQGIAYFIGLFMAIVPGMVLAVFDPTAPPELAEAQQFFLFQWLIDILQAFADSKLWWAWMSFVAITYLRFGLWLLDEIATMNQ
jgi:hypothetical protein